MAFQLIAHFIRLTPAERLYHLTRPLIGLTGSIAAGKSTALNYLASYATTISADALIHQIYQQAKTIAFLKEHFPLALTPHAPPHHLNKTYLRQLFLTNDAEATALEDFLYRELEPCFKQAVEEKEKGKHNHDQNRKSNVSSSPIIFEVPLLFEKHWESKFDQIIGIDASPVVQKARLRERHLEDAEIAQFMAHQLTGKAKMQRCFWQIRNDGDLAALQAAVQDLAQQIFTPIV